MVPWCDKHGRNSGGVCQSKDTFEPPLWGKTSGSLSWTGPSVSWNLMFYLLFEGVACVVGVEMIRCIKSFIVHVRHNWFPRNPSEVFRDIMGASQSCWSGHVTKWRHYIAAKDWHPILICYHFAFSLIELNNSPFTVCCLSAVFAARGGQHWT